MVVTFRELTWYSFVNSGESQKSTDPIEMRVRSMDDSPLGFGTCLNCNPQYVHSYINYYSVNLINCAVFEMFSSTNLWCATLTTTNMTCILLF